MIEVMSGVYQLKIPIPNNPLGNTNSYLVWGNGDYLLIDPGMNNDEAFEALQKELGEAGVTLENITHVLATHAHGDHYGLAGRVKERSKATVFAHRVVKENIEAMRGNREEHFRRMEPWLRLNGVPDFNPAELPGPPPGAPRGGAGNPPGPPRGAPGRPPFFNHIAPDEVFQGGETFSIGAFSFKVLWTPGHDPGHICLFEPERKVLFSGDHVLPVTTPNISLQNQAGVNPLNDFLNSLNAVKDLDANLILPGHEQTFTNLRARVEQLFEHHEYRNAEILATFISGRKTAYEIAQGVTWMPQEGGRKFMELGPGDRRMAVMETLAHLEAMRVQGRVDNVQKDNVIYYFRP